MSVDLEAFETKGIDTCLTCPRLCRSACPVAETESRESTSPHHLVVLGGLLKSNRVTAEYVGDHPFHCAQCGACTEACLHNNDVALLLSLSRGRLRQSGVTPKSISELCAHFGVAGNPQGFSLEEGLNALAQSAGRSIERSAETLYLPGCSTLDLEPEAASAFLRSCAHEGRETPALTPASLACCGLPLLWAGEIDGFVNHARRVAQLVGGASELISHDPMCVHALRVRYPSFGLKLKAKVHHVSEYLSDVSPKPTSESIAYFDACALSRGLGRVAEPRALIQRRTGRPPIEISHRRGRLSDCCGAGGLLPLVAPQTAHDMARARVDDFLETEASVLTTFSPRCTGHIRSVAPHIRVADVMSVFDPNGE